MGFEEVKKNKIQSVDASVYGKGNDEVKKGD